MGGIWVVFLSDCGTAERSLGKVYCRKGSDCAFPTTVIKAPVSQILPVIKCCSASLHCELRDIITGARHGERADPKV